jgi:Uri superfamily endonuclease
MPANNGLNWPPLPRKPGTYALILYLAESREIRVGKIGRYLFPAGHYIYLGSAFGPGGLAGRLSHHLKPSHSLNRLHWHVDYLRQQASIKQVWYCLNNRRREHDWAELMSQLPGATIPAPRFGASDCRCLTHLIHTIQRPEIQHFRTLVKDQFPGDISISVVEAR